MNQVKKMIDSSSNTSSHLHLGPVTHVEVLQQQQCPFFFFFSSGPSIFFFMTTTSDGDDRHCEKLFTIPDPGRIISTFHVSCSSSTKNNSGDMLNLCIAAHNEVDFFRCEVPKIIEKLTQSSSSSSPCSSLNFYCGRTLDRVVSMKFILQDNNNNNHSSILCLGHEGVICSFLFSFENDNQSPVVDVRKTYIGLNSPLGMCIAGTIQNDGSFFLGTSFGDVVEFNYKNKTTTIKDETENTKRTRSSTFTELARIKKCHTSGLVSCMSEVKVSEKGLTFLATASDERRACFVYWSSHHVHQEQEERKKIHLPYEPGRIRTVDVIQQQQHNHDQQHDEKIKSSSSFIVATGCEDGCVRCYSIELSPDDNTTTVNMIWSKHLFAGGIGGGAASLKLFWDDDDDDHKTEEALKLKSLCVFSGSFEGKVSVDEVLSLDGCHHQPQDFFTGGVDEKFSFNIASTLQSNQQLRCLCASTTTTCYFALSNGEIWSFDARISNPHRKICSTTTITPSTLVCFTDNNAKKDLLFVGSTNGEVYEIDTTTHRCSSSQPNRLIHSHPQKSAITFIHFDYNIHSQNEQGETKSSSTILSSSASGSIVMSLISSSSSGSSSSSSIDKNNNNDNNNADENQQQSIQENIYWNDVCQGRSVILPPPPSSSQNRQDNIFIACDRRGVYVFEFGSIINSTTSSSSSTTTHTSSVSGTSKKIYNSSTAFPGRADLWCPATLHWESSSSSSGSSSDFRFSVLHKNRMMQIFELRSKKDTNNNNNNNNNIAVLELIFSSVPAPACPDLPVRDVLFSSQSYLVLQKGNQLVVWDRDRSELLQVSSKNKNKTSNCSTCCNAIIDDVVAARLRSVTVVADSSSKNTTENVFRFIWSNDSKNIFVQDIPSDRRSSSTSSSSPPPESWGTCDLTCAASVHHQNHHHHQNGNNNIFVVGGDDGVISVWRKKKNDGQERLSKVSTTLQHHPSSVLALCPVKHVGGFLSVGAHATLGLWRGSNSMTCTTSSSCSFDLMYSKTPPPVVNNSRNQNNNTNSNTNNRSRESELERYLSCDSDSEFCVVGSSCGHFLVLRMVTEEEKGTNSTTRIQESRFPVHKQQDKLSPVISIGCAVLSSSSPSSLLVFCGLNNGRLALHKLDTSTTSSISSSSIVEIEDVLGQFGPDDAEINDGAVCAIKVERSAATTADASGGGGRVFLSKESGRVFVILFGPNGELSRTGIKVISQSCSYTTPRALLLLSSRFSSSPDGGGDDKDGEESLAVVEEGRRISMLSAKANNKREKESGQALYHSVVRVRGGCYLENDDDEGSCSSASASLVVVGQGIEVIGVFKNFN